ncbi:hypothetical protein [Arthrobacter sp. SDTb3-6]|uniref:hypothetical protein n=1 Tax=Arthrobacter sp. SDTb3-6 TaxID=2713571 RepID=UPI00159E8243|nr:hypothetical protein [Arthrobacter sp. SDTb3-6]NVM99932.1 hypothetical protein [Arthrobacter sp. SDTb3-6]
MRSRQPRPEAGHAAGAWSRLRALPGFKASVVAFLVTVFIGGGTFAAVANWQQSSTATIAITAGAPAITAPPPVGGVVASPTLAVRPGAFVGGFSCTSAKQQGSVAFTFTWPAVTNATSYATTLSLTGPPATPVATESVTGTTAVFTFREAAVSNGTSYLLRIEPFDGATAGDPVYKSFTFSSNTSGQCDQVTPAAAPPLGTVSPTAQPVVRGATTSTMAINWTASTGATSYVVTVKSTTSGYGTEFTTGNLSATLTFPQAATDASGNLVNPADATAPYYCDYSFRIQPMNGTTAGDPVYRTIKYYSGSASMG